MKKVLLTSIVLLAAAQGAQAEIYSCGPGCYTSNAKKGSGKADIGTKIGSYTSVKSRSLSESAMVVPQQRSGAPAARHASVAPAHSVAVANTQPAAAPVPKVSSARASGRRNILEQELNNERNALAQAQKALADGRAVGGSSDAGHQSRIRQLESAVLDRQQNIQALQRELGRM